MKKVYICERCRFLFSQDAVPDRCPDCGKETVRPAEPAEVQEYERQRQDAKNDPL